MQTQVTICNNTAVDGNSLKSNETIMTKIFGKFWRHFSFLTFAGLSYFCTFQVLKTLHKFEFKCLIFSNFLKLDNFQKDILLKVRKWVSKTSFAGSFETNFERKKPWEKNVSENYQVSQNLKKFLDYFSKSCFQILVFDKRQVKWLRTRKRKFQEKY